MFISLSDASTNYVQAELGNIVGTSTSSVDTTSLAKQSRRWRRNPKSVATQQPNQSDNKSLTSSLQDDSDLESESNHHTTKFVAECNLPTKDGSYKMRSYTYNSSTQKLEPIVMIYGDVADKEDVLVRVHDQCLTSEVFGSLRCDCREQLKESLRVIRETGGVIIYLQQEGRGIGISNKIAAYALQDEGFDTVDANTHLGFRDELREYYAVPDILRDINVRSIKLLTNNPYKIEQLSGLGVKISQRIPIQIQSNRYNMRYLLSKRDKMNHILSDDILKENHQRESMFDSAAAGLNNNAERTSQDHSNNSDNNNDDDDDKNKLIDNSVASKEEADAGYALGKHTVLRAINAIKKGEVVIVVDDADRENEGDLIMAAELATPEKIGFIVRYSSGVICISLEDSRLKELNLPPMWVNNEDPKQTAYSVSVDYKYNTSTGISAADRALTFNKLVNPDVKKEEFQRPGHVFPLRYKEGGVLSRMGHTEASLDLTKLAGLRPGGVLAEVVHDDGSMMRLPDLRVMAAKFGLVLTSVQDIKAYRTEIEKSDL